MSEVTTSIINWREYVMQKWGQEYNIPETVYRVTGGGRDTRRDGNSYREFKSTDNSAHGVYERG